MQISTWGEIAWFFDRRDFGGAETSLEARLSKVAAGPFTCLVGASFANRPVEVLSGINAFATRCQSFDVQAIYLEMNGFDINTERWFCDFFGYSQYRADPDDLDWLCDWQSERWPELTLVGLEEAQNAFSWYHQNWIWKDRPEFQLSAYTAMILVMVKFVRLVEAALQSGPLIKPASVLATAHDFDIIGRFERKAGLSNIYRRQ